MNLFKYIKNISQLLLVIVVLSAFMMSCNEDDATGHSRLVPTNPNVAITAPSIPAVSYDATNDFVYTIGVDLTEAQIVDVAVHVFQADGDATEGEDFDISTSRVIIPAGSTSSSFDLTLYGNSVRDAAESLTIQVGDERTANANVTPVTINVTLNKSPDVVLNPPPATTIDFTLRWAFADDYLNIGEDEICDYIDDLDLTIQPQGGGIYDATDLLGYAAATLSCPEEGTINVADMVDGAVYDVWFAIYSGFNAGDAGALNVYLDFERANSDFIGTGVIEGVFDSSMGGAAGVLMTIERNGDVVTLKDLSDDIIGEGRVGEVLQMVKKP